MSKSVLIIYQNIDSGAKVVTEEIIRCLRHSNSNQPLIVYRQNPHQFNGFISALKNFFWSLADCVKHINNCPTTVSVIYTPYYLAVFAYFLSQKRHLPIIFHFHGDHAITHIDSQQGLLWPLKRSYIWVFGKLIEHLQTTAIEKASQVIFVAKQAKKDMIKKYNLKLNPKQIKIIHNGVDTKIYHPISSALLKNKIDTLKIKLGFSKNQPIILYSGRIDRKKGIHQILTAIKKINSTDPKKLFGCVITHPSYKDKDSATYYHQLANRVSRDKLLVKFISQPSELIQYYQLADVCILPSEQEMMPLVMLESLACGTSFFGTKVGNMPDVLSQIDQHLILPTNAPKDIIRALRWWQNLSATKKLRLKHESLKVASRYSWQTTAYSVQKIITQLVMSSHQKNQ